MNIKPKRKMTSEPHLKLIDQFPRNVLTEGRNYGVGFAIGKKVGDEIRLVHALSCCREYLNDVAFTENSKREIRNYGQDFRPQNLLEDTRIYMVIGIMNRFDGRRYGKLQDEETEYLDKNFKSIESFLNQIEEKIGLEKTVITEIVPKRFLLTAPKFWLTRMYLISLYSLLVRVALEGFYKEGDPVQFFADCKTTDHEDVPRILPKLKKVIAGEYPKEDWDNMSDGTNAYETHAKGICKFDGFSK